MGNKNPNTSGIVEFKKEQSIIKREAVLTALEEMKKRDENITKAEVCRLAGVSKTFLYAYPELVEKINQAIDKNNQKTRMNLKNETFSNNSKDLLIDSLKRKIKTLEEENKKIKNENSILLGKLSFK